MPRRSEPGAVTIWLLQPKSRMLLTFVDIRTPGIHKCNTLFELLPSKFLLFDKYIGNIDKKYLKVYNAVI